MITGGFSSGLAEYVEDLAVLAEIVEMKSLPCGVVEQHVMWANPGTFIYFVPRFVQIFVSMATTYLAMFHL